MEQLDNYIHTKELHIESFLRKKGKVIKDIDTISKLWNDYFYRFKDINNSELSFYLKESSFYLEGCICIWSYGREVLSFKHWDLIDQLYSYFITALHQILVLGNIESSFSFPDQPLLVELKRSKGEKIIITIENDTFVVSKKLFTSMLLKESIVFFKRLSLNKKTKEYNELIKLAEDTLNTLN